MSTEFLDYVEDILDAMEKAEILIENITYDQFAADFPLVCHIVNVGHMVPHFVAVHEQEGVVGGGHGDVLIGGGFTER